MKKWIYILFPLFFAFISCEKQELSPRDSYLTGDEIVVSGSMTADYVRTRASDKTAVIYQMFVYIFDKQGIYLDCVEVKPGVENKGQTEFKNENGEFVFHFETHSSDKPLIYHFVANYHSNATETNEITMSMHAHITEDDIRDKDIYWQRYEMSHGVNENTKVENLRLIRVNAKISVNVSDEIDDFTYEGFAICNRATTGTLAALNYNAGYGQGNDGQMNKNHFAKYTKDDGTPYSYDELVNEQKYIGCLPVNYKIDKTLPSDEDFTLDAKKVFENPWNPDEGTFIIIKGRYRGHIAYYKIALGRKDPSTQEKEFDHILRNFNYEINITKIRNRGYSNLQRSYDGDFTNFVEYREDKTRNPLLYISSDHTYFDNNKVNYFSFKYLYNTSVGFRVEIGRDSSGKPLFGNLLERADRAGGGFIYNVPEQVREQVREQVPGQVPGEVPGETSADFQPIKSHIKAIEVYPSKYVEGRMVCKVLFNQNASEVKKQILRIVPELNEQSPENEKNCYDINFVNRAPFEIKVEQKASLTKDKEHKSNEPKIMLSLDLRTSSRPESDDLKYAEAYQILKDMPKAFPIKITIATLDNRIVTDLPARIEDVQVPIYTEAGTFNGYEPQKKLVYYYSLSYKEFIDKGAQKTFGFVATNQEVYSGFLIKIDRFYTNYTQTDRIKVKDLIK